MNRYQLIGLLAACLTLCTSNSAAQNLTKPQEGRAEVGKCYAACMAGGHQTALALYERVDRLTDLLISDEYFELTVASRGELVALEETTICSLAQDHVRGLDACQASCVDVETAYGVASSQARDRFRQVLTSERNALTQVGLWRDFRRTPSAGQDFAIACDRYWNEGSDVGGVSRLSALPARVRAAEQRMARLPQQTPPVSATAPAASTERGTR